MSIKSAVQQCRQLPNRFWNMMKARIEHVSVGEKSQLIGKVYVVNRGKVTIGDHGRIVGSRRLNPIGYGDQTNIIAEKSAIIKIGDYIGMANSTIYARKEIVIGNHVLLGGGTKIYDTDFHSLDYRVRASRDDKKFSVCAPVKIGDYVFVGAGSTILKGVTIGARSIIGANSVVTRNVPPDEIWAGNPAKCIRRNA